MACLDNIAAFRCKQCGHLEDEGSAGDNETPHACSCCGAGVVLNPGINEIAAKLANPDCTPVERVALAEELKRLSAGGAPVKHVHPENWETLWDATPERLKQLGLDKAHVTKSKYVPKTPSVPINTRVVALHANENVGTVDG